MSTERHKLSAGVAWQAWQGPHRGSCGCVTEICRWDVTPWGDPIHTQTVRRTCVE